MLYNIQSVFGGSCGQFAVLNVQFNEHIFGENHYNN